MSQHSNILHSHLEFLIIHAHGGSTFKITITDTNTITTTQNINKNKIHTNYNYDTGHDDDKAEPIVNKINPGMEISKLQLSLFLSRHKFKGGSAIQATNSRRNKFLMELWHT